MRAILTTVGQDKTGIIAGVSSFLAEKDINILDLSQTIMNGYFTMMMVVDLDGAHMTFADIDAALQPVRDDLQMTIHMQRMDIFDAMHRV